MKNKKREAMMIAAATAALLERGGCSRLMKTSRHNGGTVHSRSMRAKKKDNHCSGRPCID